MSAPAAISGDFATYRHVQSRKVLQLVIEVPAESAASVFAALGTPGAGEGIPVALARLAKSSEAPERPKERRPFAELPYAQQAAMRCREKDFIAFCGEKASHSWPGLIARAGSEPSAVAGLVRHWCRVGSRADIKKGHQSGDNWEVVEAEFYAWQRGRR